MKFVRIIGVLSYCIKRIKEKDLTEMTPRKLMERRILKGPNVEYSLTGCQLLHAVYYVSSPNRGIFVAKGSVNGKNLSVLVPYADKAVRAFASGSEFYSDDLQLNGKPALETILNRAEHNVRRAISSGVLATRLETAEFTPAELAGTDVARFLADDPAGEFLRTRYAPLLRRAIGKPDTVKITLGEINSTNYVRGCFLFGLPCNSDISLASKTAGDKRAIVYASSS